MRYASLIHSPRVSRSNCSEATQSPPWLSSKTPTAHELKVFAERLEACAVAYASASQMVSAAGLKVAQVRNVAASEKALKSLEQSAKKVTVDVNRSIAEAAVEAASKAKAKEALESVKQANKKAKK